MFIRCEPALDLFLSVLIAFHTRHAYFLSFGDVTEKILYSVERIRDGKGCKQLYRSR